MKKYIVTLYTLCVLYGCNDFLNIQPKGEVIPQTTKHFDMLLNSDALIIGGNCYSSFFTDDVFVPASSSGMGPELKSLEQAFKNMYTFQKKIYGESESDTQWAGSYNRIFQFNFVIENVLKSTDGTEAEKKELWAEALTGRAFEYLTLINMYAKQYNAQTAKTDMGVPLMLKVDTPEGTLTRATVEAVYTQIIKDLADAEPHLPIASRTNAFRASKEAAWGISARMHLIRGEYDKALDFANKLLEANDFLLDIKPYKIASGTEASSSRGRIIGFPDGKDNKEAIYLKFDGNETGLSYMSNISEELGDLFDWDSRDQRFGLYFTDTMFGEPLNYLVYLPAIYVNIGISTPEMYLIAAECEARIGDKNKAMTLINKLRDNRIKNNKALTADTNDDALINVLNERRRELAMLGIFRFVDLRRLNTDQRFTKTITHVVEELELKEFTEVDPATGEEHKWTEYVPSGKKETYTLEPNSGGYVYPIPPKVLRFNPGMPDNQR